MQLLSDINRDASFPKPDPGSYEWWYFDGISDDGDYQLVIIFFDGCPFSTRYIRSLDADIKKRSKDPESETSPQSRHDQHPGISISVYHKGHPIFYSMSQYPREECSFRTDQPAAVVGENSFKFSERETHGSMEHGSFDIRINERLPSGEELKGIITLSGMNPNEKLFGKNRSRGDGGPEKADNSPSHIWNMVLPRAGLECRMNLIRNGLIQKELKFNGLGYHDHNIGREPMKNVFRDWYWGRVHFRQATLIYYVMNYRDGTRDHHAWLVSPDNRRLLYSPELSRLRKKRMNRFIIRPARRLLLEEDELKIVVNHNIMADSGPFYCRYISDVTLKHPALGTEKAQGVAEYLRPDRAHRRLFWPFVHMRLRYVDQKPHWVQRSPRLYRWTW